MRFSAIALAAAVPAIVSAATLNVTVGDGGNLTFTPASVTAAMGDTVQFVFSSKNHSVVQSTFADPCTRSNVNNTQGFASGFNPVPADGSGFPSFSINVTQTAPIWFYCSQTAPVNHCKMGMVGAINPTADKTVDQFKAAAMASNGTATPGAPSGSASSTSSSASPTSSNGAVRMSGGAAGLLTLVGIVAGVTL